ncbi:hypothetical protein RclHR1_04450016 [Rhizophagus clarus]|uniref:C2H2-type domain-containing protein n=1 Tax=Rhizophagus clarus TaxID=94130 RepID=A0A2Z6RH78_9GLOM|nr:hypothetical protein RclHR1_04450016 [Rhizophagus clarus]
MVIHTCDRCGKNFPKLWKLRRHQERQFQCRQKIIPKVIQPLPAPLVPPIIQSPKNQENDPKTGSSPSTQANREEQAEPSEVTQDKFIDRHARKPREHMKTWGADCAEDADDEAFEENIPQEVGPSEVEQQDAQEQDAIPKEPIQEDIIFKECPVGRDPERPHRNHSLMSKWVGKIPIQMTIQHMHLFNQ